MVNMLLNVTVISCGFLLMSNFSLFVKSLYAVFRFIELFVLFLYFRTQLLITWFSHNDKLTGTAQAVSKCSRWFGSIGF